MERDVRLILVANNLRRVRANDPTLGDVNWSYAGVDDEDVIQLAQALEGNTHVRWVDLTYNEKLTDACTAALLDVAPRCKLINFKLYGADLDIHMITHFFPTRLSYDLLRTIRANDP
eukprot:COSAG03_NODE_4975_length_1374_cov_1.528627_1_plen_116_part_10